MRRLDRVALSVLVAAGIRWALLVVLPLALIACGGSGNGGGKSY
jgi:hypothetical protein